MFLQRRVTAGGSSRHGERTEFKAPFFLPLRRAPLCFPTPRREWHNFSIVYIVYFHLAAAKVCIAVADGYTGESTLRRCSSRIRDRKSNTIINTAHRKRQMCALQLAHCFPIVFYVLPRACCTTAINPPLVVSLSPFFLLFFFFFKSQTELVVWLKIDHRSVPDGDLRGRPPTEDGMDSSDWWMARLRL